MSESANVKVHFKLNGNSIYRNTVKLLPAIILGVTSFLLVAGPQILNPENISWLKGDASQHYQGWAFFRASDWTIPLGSNPKFGLLNNSSIIFSDSIPLFAFIFKLFKSFLTIEFQYLGFWTLACFVFQAIFSSKLISLYVRDWGMQILGAGIFVFSCPMFYRVALHTALASHFLILWALYLYLEKNERRNLVQWLFILTISALIHFYMFSIVSYFWVLSLFCAADKKNVKWYGSVFGEVALVLMVELFVFWQAGYFMSSSNTIASSGYGAYPANLLTFFNPYGWSYVFPSITPIRGFDEGFAYLGLGGMGILIAAIPPILQKFKNPKGIKISKNWVLLLWGMVPISIFAFTNNVHIGAFEFNYYLPEKIIALFGLLRSSGRMIWPVMYVILLGAILLIANYYRKPIALGILAISFCMQILDTSAGWLPYKRKVIALSFEKEIDNFKNNFWTVGIKQYKQFIALSPSKLTQDIALFAAKNNLALNYVPVARSDGKKGEFINQENVRSLINAPISDAIYFLPQWKDQPNIRIAEENLNRGLLARVGPFTIFAPNWERDSKDKKLGSLQISELSSFAPIILLNEVIDFSVQKNVDQFLLGGWGGVEVFGPLADGKEASIILPIPRGNSKMILVLKIRPYLNHVHPIQRVIVSSSNGFKQAYKFDKQSNHLIEIPVSADKDSNFIKLNFGLLDAVRPIDLGVGRSDSYHSIGIMNATYKEL